MGSKNLSLTSTLILLVLMFGLATSDVNQDKAECTDKLLALANCLPFVTGQAKVPSMDCCIGAKEVVEKSKRCLCILIKDHDDPSLGLKVNVTLALMLPSSCRTPTNVSQCVDILHLAPQSQEAKIFENFQKTLEKKNSSTLVPSASETTGKGTSTRVEDKNGGGWGKRRLGAEVLFGILPFVLISFIV